MASTTSFGSRVPCDVLRTGARNFARALLDKFRKLDRQYAIRIDKVVRLELGLIGVNLSEDVQSS